MWSLEDWWRKRRGDTRVEALKSAGYEEGTALELGWLSWEDLVREGLDGMLANDLRDEPELEN